MTNRHSIRRSGAVALVIAALLVSACTPSTSAPSPATQSRGAAITWLLRQFDPSTGTIPSAFTPGTADVGGTAYAVASLRASHVGAATQRTAVQELHAEFEPFVQDAGGVDRPGQLARLILAVVAVGDDPHDWQGTDLVARLEATQVSAGPDAGFFGAQDATYDGAYRQGISLAALSLVTPRSTTVDTAVAWLQAQQCSDGSWMPYRSNPATPCAFDPVTFSGPDSNSTAMAVLGLRAVGASPIGDAESWFSGARTSDGGWGYDAFSTADPDSTGLVVAARRALGVRPDAAAIGVLRSFQFGDAAPPSDRGAFFYPPFSGPATPNLLSTNDALLGLAPGVWPAVLTG